MVVVWTVSWPRRERCPGTLRVTIPRPPSPFLLLLLLLLPPPSHRRVSFLTRPCSPFLSVYSLFLFSLCTSRSSSRPRSRVHSTADFPVPRGDPSAPRRLTNMALVRSLLLPSFGRTAPAKKRAAKRRTAWNSHFAHLNPSYSLRILPMLLSEKFRSFEEDIQTLRLPSIDSDRFKRHSSIVHFLHIQIVSERCMMALFCRRQSFAGAIKNILT